MDVAAKIREQYAGPRVTEAVMFTVKSTLDKTIQRLTSLRDRYESSLLSASSSASTLRDLAKGVEVDLDDKSIKDFDKAVGGGLTVAKQQVVEAMRPIAELMKATGVVFTPATERPQPEAKAPEAKEPEAAPSTPRGVTTRNPRHNVGPDKMSRPTNGEGEAPPPPTVSTKPSASEPAEPPGPPPETAEAALARVRGEGAAAFDEGLGIEANPYKPVPGQKVTEADHVRVWGRAWMDRKFQKESEEPAPKVAEPPSGKA